MITVKQSGDFSKSIAFLGKAKDISQMIDFDRYGQEGVNALSSATPIDSGLTATSWYYKIIRRNTSISLNFYNSNVQDGVPIAIIIQYGHATKNGGWVEGRDYINPAVQPIFDSMTECLCREVAKL